MKAQGHITVRRRPKDGDNGSNAFRLDLNNENDSLLYDAEGNLLSGSVVSVATLYDGDAAVSSGVVFAISERVGCTAAQATISGNTITVSGLSGSGYVMVTATYNNKTYSAKFTLKRLVGTVKYDLLVTPDAIAYNTTTGTKSASTINVKIYRTAQNNSGGVSRTLMTSVPTGYTLKVDGTNVANYVSSGYTFNVNTSQNSHVVSLYQSSTLVDEETVPINKSTNGTDGTDGSDGHDGEDGISTINYYKWGTTKPTKPSDTSLTGSGALPCPSGWTTQCEDRMQFLNPNSSSYLNWTAQSDGSRKLVATTVGTFKQAELIKVVLPASGKIDIRAAILSEAGYDFIYVSPLFSTEAAAKNDLANFLSVCTRYAYISTNGYDANRAIKALGYTTLAQGTISTQNSGALGTYYLYVAYVKDSSDSASPSGWTGGYAEYATSLGESIIRYAVSGTGVLTHSGSTYIFSDIAWSDVFAYANDGPVGLTYRTSSWASGVEYRNDAGRSGEPRYIDICFNMPVSMIGETGFEAYKCTRTHISDSANIPLGASGYWEKVNNMQPIITALVLAAKIRADYIDVGSIAADQAFIQTLNAQSLNAKTVNTVETGNGHITMEDDGLRMFTPSGEERLLISGDALSYLSSASSTGPSSNVLASLSANVSHTVGDYAQSSETKTIQTLTISEKRIVSLPARTISINGGFVDDDPNLCTNQPVFMMIWAKWLVDGTAIATVSKQISCCSDGVSFPFSFSTSMALPACNASVSAGSHTIAIEFDVEFYNTNNGIISGNYFGLYMSNTVTANSILWSSSVMKTEIASDGFRSALSADVYVLVQLSGSTNNIEFRNQNYGIRIRSDGIYATKTGANGWTNVTSKLLP